MHEGLQHEHVAATTEVPPFLPLVNPSSILSLDPTIVHNVFGSVESISPANVQPQSEVFVDDVFPPLPPNIAQTGLEETDSLVVSSPAPTISVHI
ncbi:hypothetical protein MRB53_030370 [Persea americana]|uniref:Uncharacterized protein n=1 Tax=Persea americana TaxID=3435 RepID=A0ACC2KL33_PERAE|nr:hypothetical protein MRB53_030370 [Persea americana]